MTKYIQVLDDENEVEIEIPIEEDGTLLLSTLSGQFPNACGLKYKNPQTGGFRGVRLCEGRLHPPEKSWGTHVYYVVFLKDNKRKGEEATNGGIITSKTKRLEKKCSDLIVLGLPWKSTEEDLQNYFSKFGDLLLVQVKRDPKTNQSKGYGFIRFGKYDQQVKCMSMRHNIDGRWCDVTIPNSNENAQQIVSRKVFIARCTEDITAEDLRSYFNQFGEVVDVFIPKPFRSFAFVTFSEPEVAHSLCGEDHIVKGVSVHVSYASPKGTDKYGEKRMQPNNSVPIMQRGGYPHPQANTAWQAAKTNHVNKAIGFPPNIPPQDAMGMIMNSAMLAAAQAMLQGQTGNWAHHMAPPPPQTAAPPPQHPPGSSGENAVQTAGHAYTAAQTSTPGWGWGHHTTEPQPGSYPGWGASNRQQQGWS